MMKKEFNIFTIDIEDTIYTADCPAGYYYSNYEQAKTNIINNTKELLRILKVNNATATFFVLGKLAEDIPNLINEIYDSGHEIANHGYSHISINNLSPVDFKLDLERSSDAIYKVCKSYTTGFRAPYFSINSKTLWSIDILKQLGFKYDSSVQPFGYHPDYGMKNSSSQIYRFDNGLIEIPMSVTKTFGFKIPCSGGAYFRFYPYKIFSHLFRTSNEQNNYSIFYIHPWELGGKSDSKENFNFAKFRKYYNSEFTINKLEKLFSEFSFVSVQNYLNKNGVLI
jgi:polysaccharide deacetylase family protein (PEP-CTERM system associated)